METIDQLSVALSLGATFVLGIAALIYSLQALRSGLATALVVSRFRKWSLIGALFCGSVLLFPLVWVIETFQLRQYYHHFAYLVWGVGLLANAVLGVALMAMGTWLLERKRAPNPGVHADAQDIPARR